MSSRCAHLEQIAYPDLPAEIAGCEECLADGLALAAPAPMHDLRPHRLLRRLAEQARDRALPRDRAPGDPLGRAGRGLVLVLPGRIDVPL